MSSCNHGCPSPPCQAINYWKNAQLCQQFYYIPCSYAVQEDCANYQVAILINTLGNRSTNQCRFCAVHSCKWCIAFCVLHAHLHLCFVLLLHFILRFNIISTMGDQLDGFTYLVACHCLYILYGFVCFFYYYFVANKLSFSGCLSVAISLHLISCS